MRQRTQGPVPREPPPNWYPDPNGSGRVRWSDGTRWTEQSTSVPKPLQDQPSAASGFGTGGQAGRRPKLRVKKEQAAYEIAYAELNATAMSLLAALDTPEAESAFVTQVAQRIQDLSARIPEFYAGEFLHVFADSVKRWAVTEVPDLTRLSNEMTAQLNQLDKRLEKAKAAGNREREHAMWRERQTRAGELLAEIEDGKRCSELWILRLGACERLATTFGIRLE